MSITTQLNLDQQAFLDGIFAANKALYGDLRMEDTGTGDAGAAGTAAGDAGAGAGAANAGSGTAGTGDTAAGAQGAATGDATAATWNPDAWDGKVETLPKAAQKVINDLRKADGDERVAKKNLDAIMAILNPEAAGEKVDPVKLAADLQATQATAQSTALELAIYKAAIAAGAKPDALTDSRNFMEKAAALDLTDTAALAAAVTEAVKNNPALKAARAATSSSVNHAGGSGEGQHDLDAQIAEAEKAGNHALAISLKRQRAYAPQTTT